ncbi:hypothetical protein G7Y89_g12246 [Cudoniella acicularis]|uniref:Heterokaryon incompatibility domain-containing protein n=1 Tax=Cudoniella acicularis TaxID=354080 RepID=A0A8H4VXJ1_9HELO|nr:hypothetical protein G7Y89_g12246 [Cudoniella acicularis]
MFCEQCQKLFDLGTSFRQYGDDAPRIRHHESLKALRHSGRSECELCERIARRSRAGNEPDDACFVSTANDSITFEVLPDSFIFYIPMRLESDRPGEFVYGEDEVKFYVNVDECDSLSSLFTWRPLSDDSSSDSCFAVASKWINNCLDTHKDCPNHLSPLPTRVIDVGSQTREPFLYISNGQKGPWLTLSHCWGTERILRTIGDNIDQHCQKIPLSDLPLSFQDAIIITRRLGYQYVWIDSLCIIQDSDDDWRREAQKMAGIYQNALLTISAEASDGAHKGIFRSIKRSRVKSDSFTLPCYSTCRQLRGNLRVDLRNRVPSSEAMPLQTRAWVLQERSLSLRKLQYQATGLVWTCPAASAIEITPWNTTPARFQTRSMELHRIPHYHLPALLDLGVEDPVENDDGTLSWWYHQVSDYMKRSLTYRKDRFPAIAGIAREFSKRTGYHYASGIWLEDFQRGLLWEGSVKEEDYQYSPTWSWACADWNASARMAYPIAMLMKHGREFGAGLVGISKDITEDVFLSPTLPKVLTLRAWCRDTSSLRSHGNFDLTLNTRKTWNRPEPTGNPTIRLLSKPPITKNWSGDVDQQPLIIYPDLPLNAKTTQEILEKRNAIILRVAEFSAWPGMNSHMAVSRVYGLLLVPIDGDEGAYRRIGLVTISKQNPLADIRHFGLRTVKIV